VQKKQIEPRQPQPLEARLDGLPQNAFDLIRRWFAQIALAGYPHTVG
jgi:hypothetical protein